MSSELIAAYYRAFNARDYPSLLALLSEDVVHDINQGGRELGRPQFAAFLERMDACYREQLVDIVILSDERGMRFAAEFTVLGKYLKAEDGLPPARGQMYRLPAASLFCVADGQITRVTTYYNLQTWISQVSGAA